MRSRFFTSVTAPLVVIAVVSLAPPSVAGQGSTTAPKNSTTAARKTPAKPGSSLRTPWGDPDLQGVWDYRTITLLERPIAFGSKEVLTDEEVAEVERDKADFEAADPKDRNNVAASTFSTSRAIGDPVDEQAYNSYWFDTGRKVVPSNRTSLILDPPDGRIPYTPEGRQRASRRRTTDGPEDRGLTERCILSLNAGPPIRPSAYNNNAQIFQAPGYVTILNEMIHDVRIIPLDGRPHVSPVIRQWLGDSRGRWEGNTLVVETTNFRGDVNFSGSTDGLSVVEQFTRVAPDTISYEFTVNDPKSFSKPWTAAFPMTKTEDQVYEYACHEGNRGLSNILSGARAQEKAADEAATTK